MRLALALIACLATPALATQEYILPTLFDVTGVSVDDALNIRERPDASSAIVGTLAPDATGIEVTGHDATGRWGRILTGEGTGWVSLRYLAYRTDVWVEGAAPPGLACLGTEPFWSLAPQDGILRYETPEGGRNYPLASILATGIPRDPRRVLIGAGDAGRVTATVVAADCSDGMSDRLYGLDATVVIEDGDGARLLTGCCTISR